jgi:hypothetical protein
MFSSGGLVGFVLICAHFAFGTPLCGRIERTGILVYPTSYHLFVFLHCCVRFGSIVRESTYFLIFACFYLESLILSSFRILQNKLQKKIIIKKKKKKKKGHKH